MATTNIGLTLCGTLKPGKESQDTRVIATAASVGTSIKQKNINKNKVVNRRCGVAILQNGFSDCVGAFVNY